MHKIFCFVNSDDGQQWLDCSAVGDDGVCLAQHICSHECYLPHDLGITGDWKHELYDAHFGAGNWELEHVRDPKNHEAFQEVIKKAQAEYEARKAMEPMEPVVSS